MSYEKNLLCKKQFGFQSGYSTDHTINQLVDVLQFFENKYFTLGIFIDLSKVLHTVDHSILLLRKLEMYGRHGKIFLALRVTYQIENNLLRPRKKSALTCN